MRCLGAAGRVSGRHIDVNATDHDQDAELERLLALGARAADVGQAGTESWHVLADPEGNKFCLLRTVPTRPVAAHCLSGQIFRTLRFVSTQPSGAARTRSNYEARPGRDAVVAASLADLRGPAEGTIELPLRLFWSSRDRSFDLGDPEMVRCLYETVLREATRPDDLAAYLDGGMLVRIWSRLFLPKGVRRAWEDRYPVLRAARTAAA